MKAVKKNGGLFIRQDTRTQDELHHISINGSANKTKNHQKRKRSVDFLSKVKSYFLVEPTTKSPMALLSDSDISSAYQLVRNSC